MNYSQYDKIADQYDSLFVDEESLMENEEVGDMLRPLSGSVLDIGCGTGLLTEILDINPEKYMGVDPSREMLKRFIAKHPSYKYLVCAPYDGHIVDCHRFDNVISLFGSPSYLSDDVLKQFADYKGRLFLMFYGENYHPATYEMCGVEFEYQKRTFEYICSLFSDTLVRDYRNYIIVSR